MLLIGVDTNVVVRLFVTDDEEQHRAAVAFFGSRSRASPAFICLIVVVEVVWVLSRIYKLPRSKVLEVVGDLTGRPDVVFEGAGTIEHLLETATATKADLADLVIAAVNSRSGCDHTLTFDQDAAKLIPGMELLA